MKQYLIALLFIASVSVATAETVSFNQHIRPILADRCFSCHGPDSASRRADLRLDQEEQAKAVLKNEGLKAIHPGHPDKSAILQRITSTDPDEVMPPPDAKISVSRDEIELLQRWIQQGARWEKHWAFVPPVVSPTPKTKNRDWVKNEIDAFILRRLEESGVAPSPKANRETLLRRKDDS
ncbi:MAG: c-type cytochrome domain-containing protein, partial [Verrucomicrobiota bacterium]